MGGIGSPNLPLPETRHLVLLGATDWGGAQKGLTKAKKHAAPLDPPEPPHAFRDVMAAGSS